MPDIFSNEPLLPRLGATPVVVTLQAIGDRTMSLHNVSQVLRVSFPCMPESIDLSRTNTIDSPTVQAYPDGCVHVYQKTSLLRIPFRFKVSAYDETYCVNGPIDLLHMASALHAMAMPIKDKGGSFVDGPTSVLLNIMMSPSGKGVRSVGYLESVSALLKGPWLNSIDSSYFNLPSSGEFTFQFVQAPNYRNTLTNPSAKPSTSSPGALTVKETGQAYADDVRDFFYNTLDLSATQKINSSAGVALGTFGAGGGRGGGGGNPVLPPTNQDGVVILPTAPLGSLPTSLTDSFI